MEATFTIATRAGGFVCNNTGQIQVATGGRLLKNSGGTTTVSTVLDNDGTVQAAQGTLSLPAGPGSDTGVFLANAAAVLIFSGARGLAASGRFGGAGLAHFTAGVTMPDGATLDPAALTLDSGTLTLDGAAPATTLPLVTLAGGTFAGNRNRTITTLNSTSGTLSGSHTATVTGAFTKSGGGQLRLEDSISFRPEVDASWSGGDICITTNAVMRISATFTIATGAAAWSATPPGRSRSWPAGGCRRARAARRRSRRRRSTPERSRSTRARQSTPAAGSPSSRAAP